MSAVDPVAFGGLVEAVKTLTLEVKDLRADVKTMREQLTGGRGVITGLIVAAGGIGAGVHHLIDKVLGRP